MKDFDENIKQLAAIAYGEASPLDDASEIKGIAFSVANRARAWNKSSVADLIKSDPNYTYAINGTNQRYEIFMKIKKESDIKDKGMNIALEAAKKAWNNEGPDPSNGAFWWDGIDFKTNYKKHPKVLDGFKFSDVSHNIFNVPEKHVSVKIYWKIRDKKTGKEVNSKERGSYDQVWISTAAHGKTIFWLHDSDYLKATGGKSYR